MEADFGFDEYIMPTTYAEMPKLESYDAQLYPSGTFIYKKRKPGDVTLIPYFVEGMGYVCDPSVMSTMPVPIPHQTPVMTLDHQQPLLPSSPENESVHSRQLSPPATTPPLLSCSPTSAHVISEKIAQVNKLPESFLPEFHQYSKETYENGASNSKKRRRKEDDDQSNSDQEDDMDSVSAAELRRQIHIQSEQKRRAQIKDGFDELRQHLPGCVNKKMSKAALLHRSKLICGVGSSQNAS